MRERIEATPEQRDLGEVAVGTQGRDTSDTAKDAPEQADKPTPRRRVASAPPRARRTGIPLTEEEKFAAYQDFLTSLARFGIVSKACKAAGINRDTAYAWRRTDKAFALGWDRALEDAVEVLEQEAWRRAVRGTKKPIYQGGQHVGDVREYSDTLLQFLLRGAAPKKYRDHQQVEHTGTLPISISITKKPKPAADGGAA